MYQSNFFLGRVYTFASRESCLMRHNSWVLPHESVYTSRKYRHFYLASWGKLMRQDSWVIVRHASRKCLYFGVTHEARRSSNWRLLVRHASREASKPISAQTQPKIMHDSSFESLWKSKQENIFIWPETCRNQNFAAIGRSELEKSIKFYWGPQKI